MLIRITNKDCGLMIGMEYDLCPMSANTLINNGQAVRVRAKPTPEQKQKKKNQKRQGQ